MSSNGRLGRSRRLEDAYHSLSSRLNAPFPNGLGISGTRPQRKETEDERKPAPIPPRLTLKVDHELDAEDDAEEQEQDSKQPTIRKRRALVIEDSINVRKTLARALDKLGYDVTQAENGLEGLNRLKETLFDLTLCDFLMPVMDGMDCVKQFRDWEKENRPWFSAWIVGISAHANANDGGQGITAGMNEFRPKPVSINYLKEIQQSQPVAERSKTLDELEASFRSGSRPDEQTTEEASTTKKRNGHDMANGETKRARTQDNVDQTKSIDLPANPVCLIATDKPSRRSNQVLLTLERDGWKVVVVNDGNEALRLLKMRNWDCVLIEDDLPLLPGSACIETFREWEEENRVNRQRNTFLVCSEIVPAPADTSAIVQPPTGFDNVINRPLVWNDLDYLLKQEKSRLLDIVVRKC